MLGEQVAVQMLNLVAEASGHDLFPLGLKEIAVAVLGAHPYL